MTPHPFTPVLFVRATVIGDAQPGFVITDAGFEEIDTIKGDEHAEIVAGALPGAE